jgi:hypothetical protein
MKTAFYPCCADDIQEPRLLLRNYVDEIIFCDLRARLSRWRKRLASEQSKLPMARFLVGDVREIIRDPAWEKSPPIRVLFYRRDGDGEGGSGVFILGDDELPFILKRFPAEGGLIITDGSNAYGGDYRRMVDKNGLSKHGWNFTPLNEQPFKDTHALSIISVTRSQEPAGPSPRDSDRLVYGTGRPVRRAARTSLKTWQATLTPSNRDYGGATDGDG